MKARARKRHSWVTAGDADPWICRRCGLRQQCKLVATADGMLIRKSVCFPRDELWFVLGRGITMPRCRETLWAWSERMRPVKAGGDECVGR